jgi:phosphatidate cytidylyltransferase
VQRILSALVLAPLAIAAAWQGGWAFAAFWALAAFGVWWEWSAIVAATAARLVMLTGMGALMLAFALAATGRFVAALIVIVLGAGATNVVAPPGRGIWVGTGMIYAGLLFVAPVLLRQSEGSQGFNAIMLLFAVVWATDVVAYFVGRLIGGPRLWSQISPGKTWSGALGGAFAGSAAGACFPLATGLGSPLYLAFVGFCLSIASQCGDLFESWVKRQFGAKDSSHLIPGHGGLMDRLDGFVAAAIAATLYVSLRASVDAAGHGLLQW